MTGEAQQCEQILRSLPDWFGIEEAIVSYVRDIVELETFVAPSDAEVLGFVTLRRHNPQSAEIQVLAVRHEAHRRGIGTKLVRYVEGLLSEAGVSYLQVKTLGPSRPNPAYAATRKFYSRIGFEPLEENRLWGETNPCLIMVKHLACLPVSE